MSVRTSELVGKAGLTGTRKAGDNCKKSITGRTGGLLVTEEETPDNSKDNASGSDFKNDAPVIPDDV